MNKILFSIFLLSFFLISSGCSSVHTQQNQMEYDNVQQALEKEIGNGQILATETINHHKLYLIAHHLGTKNEEVTVGMTKKTKDKYIWVSSPSFRIDAYTRFDFDPQTGEEPINLLIGKVNNTNTQKIKIEGYAKELNVYNGYYWAFNLPQENVIINENL